MRHNVSVCEARLRALPNYDRFRCTPPEFICACGRRWVHVCDEAEGCAWYLGEPSCETTRQNCSWPYCKCEGVNWFSVQVLRRQHEPVHLPQLLAQEFGISTSEARRCISQGGVRLDGTVIRELDAPRWAVQGRTLTLGKRREMRVP